MPNPLGNMALEDALDLAILDYAGLYPDRPDYYPEGAASLLDLEEPLRSTVIRERQQGIVFGLAIAAGLTPQEAGERIELARRYWEYSEREEAIAARILVEDVPAPEGAW